LKQTITPPGNPPGFRSISAAFSLAGVGMDDQGADQWAFELENFPSQNHGNEKSPIK